MVRGRLLRSRKAKSRESGLFARPSSSLRKTLSGAEKSVCIPARQVSNRKEGIRCGALVCPMRLERLEINGFKSFSDRSELAFDKGVTAIVGPNGCGKSNVADAITWVMGEQSAKSLRGERMEDIIFSGSDARKPTAVGRSSPAVQRSRQGRHRPCVSWRPRAGPERQRIRRP